MTCLVLFLAALVVLCLVLGPAGGGRPPFER